MAGISAAITSMSATVNATQGLANSGACENAREQVPNVSANTNMNNNASNINNNSHSTAEQQNEKIATAVEVATQATAAVEEAIKTKTSKTAKIPEEMKKAIDKHMKKAQDRISKVINSKKRLSKENEQYEIMQEEGRYPAGVRPFRSAQELAELDDRYDNSDQNDYQFTITIKRGTSRREALAQLHHSISKEIKGVNIQALQARINSEATTFTKQHILDTCKARIEEVAAVDKLDLDDPKEAVGLKERIHEKLEEEYKKMIDDIRSSEKKQQEKEERKKSNEEKDKDEV
eukprot:TRINITY_DN21840_c0_g1_i1.p1 TRINITY_DN21840_c0_g1~~TRINITY_DN21840_c0_g1_i1.p1  ORF type:complete len:305 (+),score=76.91 TRINITY_DN21840_c0_g1_i1:48-917(+)